MSSFLTGEKSLLTASECGWL